MSILAEIFCLSHAKSEAALTPPDPAALAPLSQAWERCALVGFPDGLAQQDRGVGGEGKIGRVPQSPSPPSPQKLILNTRIDPSVHQIDENTGNNNDRGEEDHDALHRGIIAIGDGFV